MLRRIGALAVLVLALLAASPAPADPYTHAFDTLRASVVARIAELTGTLTPAEAKEKAALDKISSLLAAPSTGLAGDVKTAKKVAAAVKRGGLLGSPIASQLLDAIAGLSGEVSALIDALRDRLQEIPRSVLREKAEAALDKIGSRLDAAGDETGPAKFAKRLLDPTKDAGKTEKNVAKAETANGITPCTPGVVSMTANLGGTSWQAQTVAGQLTAVPPLTAGSPERVLYVIVIGRRGLMDNADKLEIGISLDAATVFAGTPPFTVNGGSVDVRYTYPNSAMYVAVTGTITITEADPKTRRMKGSFDVDAGPYSNPVASDRHFSGDFEITCVKVTRP